jgi:hypothetical protein
VVEAEAVLFMSDGDQALEAIRREHFEYAPHPGRQAGRPVEGPDLRQLDWPQVRPAMVRS